MADERASCPTCAQPFSPEDAFGLCPRCLLERAIVADGALPRAFGRYTLLEECGRGGMGVVYRAWDPDADRVVALKMLHARELANEDDARRFRDEGKRASSLRHAHIVTVYEVGEHDSCGYFTMEYVDGYSLAERAEPRTDPRRAAEVVRQLAEAVHHAHQRGIHHRDLKPANVLLDGGEPRLVDFGIARRIDAPADAGRNAALNPAASTLAGTPAYMAPEQLVPGHELTSAVDVYGLGGILYELLCGRPPHDASTVAERLARGPPPSLHALAPLVDRDLDAVCRKCLEPAPADRYQSAAGVAAELRRWLDGEPVLARPLAPRERIARAVRRNVAVTALAATALVLLVTVALVAVSVARAQEAELRADALDVNAYAARALSGAVLFELDGLAEKAREAALDPRVRAALSADGDERARAADAWRASAKRGPFDSLLLLRADGTWLARAPLGDASLVGASFGWREYFHGAAALAARRSGDVHVSRAYESLSDRSVRFSLVAPVYDDAGAWLGVLQAAVVSGDALGQLTLEDPDEDARIATLVARRDRQDASAPLPDDWYVLTHAGVAAGSRHVMPNTGALARLPVRDHDDALAASQLATSTAPVLRDECHHDPIADASTSGRPACWLAAVAPVGGTAFAVIVQTRTDAVIGPNERLGNRLAAAAAGALALAVVVVVVLVAWDRTRRSRPPSSRV